MKHESAVLLWNNALQINKEQASQVTHLGCAAVAKDAPLWITQLSQNYMQFPDLYKDSIDRVKRAAAFLHEWADAIEFKEK